MLSFRIKLKALLMCFSALFCTALIAQNQSNKEKGKGGNDIIAIFHPVSNRDMSELLKTMVCSVIEAELVNKGYKIADRTRTDDLIKSKTWGRDGIIDRKNELEIGGLLNANFVCTPRFLWDNNDLLASCAVVGNDGIVLMSGNPELISNAVNANTNTINNSNVLKGIESLTRKMEERATLADIQARQIKREKDELQTERDKRKMEEVKKEEILVAQAERERENALKAEQAKKEEVKMTLFGDRLKRSISDEIWRTNTMYPRGHRPNRNDFKIEVDLSNLTLNENRQGDRCNVVGRIKVTLENLKTDQDATEYFEIKTDFVTRNDIYDELVKYIKETEHNYVSLFNSSLFRELLGM